MTFAPWDYLFLSFNSKNFPDLFHPTWVASAILLAVLLVLYLVRTRALHRHPPYPRCGSGCGGPGSSPSAC